LIVLGLVGTDVSLENGELTERWWHKATDPRRIAELPRLKMNSVSDLRVCGYCLLLIRLPGGWEAFILEERREGVKGEGTVK
jgi:hypothetical protein